MFAKIFKQIFDSSIAENYRHRHVFMDLLVLADAEGVLDMTVEAIARRTNVPLEQVREAISALSSPDPQSRTGTDDGRRLLALDPGRAWGWRIVNYQEYRRIRDEEARREYFRTYRKDERAAKGKTGKKQYTLRAPGTKRLKGGLSSPADPVERPEGLNGAGEAYSSGDGHSGESSDPGI